MKVKEVMTPDVVKVYAEESVKKAAELMKQWDIGAVPVEHDGKFSGMLTDRDIILRCVATGNTVDNITAGDIMTSHKLICVSPEHSVIEAARIMAKEQVRRLPVCENGKIVGILSLSDLAGAKRMFAETASAFCDICEDRSSDKNNEDI